MLFTISFFLTDLTALVMSASWPSWMTPVSFCARRRRKLCLILLKQNSIGL